MINIKNKRVLYEYEVIEFTTCYYLNGEDVHDKKNSK